MKYQTIATKLKIKVFALLLEITGFGVLIWKGGWLITLGVFLLFWASNLNTND